MRLAPDKSVNTNTHHVQSQKRELALESALCHLMHARAMTILLRHANDISSTLIISAAPQSTCQRSNLLSSTPGAKRIPPQTVGVVELLNA